MTITPRTLKLFKFKSSIPITALLLYCTLLSLEKLQLIPDPFDYFNSLAALYSEYSFLFLFLIIFIESILYFGFYFPGQLFAVLIVLANDPTFANVVLLSMTSIVAVTFASLLNYQIGTVFPKKHKRFRLRHLAVAMLHLNLLALYMFELGMARAGRKPILYAGLLNIPYYLLLFAGTFLIKDLVYAEDTYYLLILLAVWTAISLFFDLRKKNQRRHGHSSN